MSDERKKPSLTDLLFSALADDSEDDEDYVEGDEGEDDEDDDDDEYDDDEEMDEEDEDLDAEVAALAAEALMFAEGQADGKEALYDDSEGEGEGEEGEEGEEEEGEEEEEPAFGGASMISQLLEKSGPIVSVVVLKADGSAEERKLDMTPRLNMVAAVLGGPATFVGQYEEEQVVVLCRRDQTQDLPLSKHKLAPPLDGEVVRGDMVCVRMDEDAEPRDFTLAEYQAIASRAAAGAGAEGAGAGRKRKKPNKRQRDKLKKEKAAAAGGTAEGEGESERGR